MTKVKFQFLIRNLIKLAFFVITVLVKILNAERTPLLDFYNKGECVRPREFHEIDHYKSFLHQSKK